MPLSLPALEHTEVETNGVTLHVVTAGPADGDPVVLLHGFPEFWYGWRHQLPALVDAGYRVVVPDQRGYNRSDQPTGVDAYTIDTIAADAAGLLDALGYDRVRFVGHDWGAAVAWYLLLAFPDRVERAVTMNVPHPTVFGTFLRRRPSQLLKSWYVFCFQLPALPERALRAADWRGMRWFLDSANRERAFTEADVRRYREAWSQPRSCSGMVNWYRAHVRGGAAAPPTTRVDPPTMLVWGTRDPYLHREMAHSSIRHCDDGRLELVPDATHWLHHEVPDRVNRLLLDFLGGAPGG